MANTDFERLRQKAAAGKCTPEELDRLDKASDSSIIGPQSQPTDEDEDVNYYASAMRKPKRQNWRLNILLVAASIAFIGGTYTYLQKKDPVASQSYSTDVSPGGNRALLTLENGKKIQLSDSKTGIVVDASKLTYNDGTLIDNEKSQSFTVSTPRGGTYQVRLPDGSIAWLNAASSLTYSSPLKSDGGIRRVKLIGEAYFEVAKDKEHPFVVSTDKQNVTVLGTHFNINSYKDERAVRTTLLEGSVRVDLISYQGAPLPEKTKILKPGMQAVNSGAIIEVNEVDPDLAISWKNGEFAFRNEQLGDIMKNVARWYDVEVVYEDPDAQYKQYGGSISKYENISKVLGMLELTGNVKFKIEGKKIIVIN